MLMVIANAVVATVVVVVESIIMWENRLEK